MPDDPDEEAVELAVAFEAVTVVDWVLVFPICVNGSREGPRRGRCGAAVTLTAGSAVASEGGGTFAAEPVAAAGGVDEEPLVLSSTGIAISATTSRPTTGSSRRSRRSFRTDLIAVIVLRGSQRPPARPSRRNRTWRQTGRSWGLPRCRRWSRPATAAR